MNQNSYSIKLFNDLFLKTSSHYKKGEFFLKDITKLSGFLNRQIQLFQRFGKINQWHNKKIVFCFADENLKKTAIKLKRHVLKILDDNFIFCDSDSLFKVDLSNVKCFISMKKIDKKIYEKCLRKDIFFVSVFSEEVIQPSGYYLPVDVNNINQIVWLMLLFKNIYETKKINKNTQI